MKNKILTILSMMIICLMSIYTLNSFAMISSATMHLTASKDTYNLNDENEIVTITVRLDNLQSNNGIIAYSAKLEYDHDKLTYLDRSGAGLWAAPSYSEEDGVLIADRADNNFSSNGEDLCTIRFKLKNAGDNVVVKLSNIELSSGELGGRGIKKIDDAQVSVNIKATPSGSDENPTVPPTSGSGEETEKPNTSGGNNTSGETTTPGENQNQIPNVDGNNTSNQTTNPEENNNQNQTPNVGGNSNLGQTTNPGESNNNQNQTPNVSENNTSNQTTNPEGNNNQNQTPNVGGNTNQNQTANEGKENTNTNTNNQSDSNKLNNNSTNNSTNVNKNTNTNSSNNSSNTTLIPNLGTNMHLFILIGVAVCIATILFVRIKLLDLRIKKATNNVSSLEKEEKENK